MNDKNTEIFECTFPGKDDATRGTEIDKLPKFMNSKIKELIEQATTEEHGVIQPRQVSTVYHFDKELFAELIVRECISALWEEDCHVSDLAIAHFNRNKEKIRQHFGLAR